jgi:hypothetical protein
VEPPLKSGISCPGVVPRSSENDVAGEPGIKRQPPGAPGRDIGDPGEMSLERDCCSGEGGMRVTCRRGVVSVVAAARSGHK